MEPKIRVKINFPLQNDVKLDLLPSNEKRCKGIELIPEKFTK